MGSEVGTKKTLSRGSCAVDGKEIFNPLPVYARLPGAPGGPGGEGGIEATSGCTCSTSQIA